MKMKMLKRLDQNETVTFSTPLLSNEKLVRTGTSVNGSCFFYAILMASDKRFRQLDEGGREEYLAITRKKIASSLQIEDWEKMGKGTVSFLRTFPELRRSIRNFYIIIEDPNVNKEDPLYDALELGSSKVVEKYSLITEIIERNELLKTIEGSSSLKHIEDKLEAKFKSKLRELTDIDEELGEYIQKKYNTLIRALIKFSKERSFSLYKEKLANPKEWIDEYSIEYISSYFDRDLFFISAKNRLPYYRGSFVTDKGGNRRCIVILWIDENHYEVIGRLNVINGVNSIEREFSHNDPIIRAIKSYRPEKDKKEESKKEFGDWKIRSPPPRDYFHEHRLRKTPPLRLGPSKVDSP